MNRSVKGASAVPAPLRKAQTSVSATIMPIAAGALYALRHNRERLVEDHATAQIIAQAVRAAEGLELRPDRVETNIVIFRVSPELASAGAFAATLDEEGVRVLAVGRDLVRAVTHLHITTEDAQRAAEIAMRRADTDDVEGAHRALVGAR